MENYDSILTKEGSMDMEGSWPPATASGMVQSMECSQEIPAITKVKCSPEIHTRKKMYMGRRPEIDTTVVGPGIDTTIVGPEIDTNILSEMGSGSIELKDCPNWAQIPHGALSLIFQKHGAVNVQLSAKAVCRSWRRVALKGDLSLWRCIDMRSIPFDILYRIREENLTMLAVQSSTLSNTPVEELHLTSASDDLLINIAPRTTGLRCWTLMCCLDVSPKVLIDFLSRSPLLEELRLCICFFSHETFRDIGRTCSELKRLWVAAEPDSIVSPDSDSEYEYRLSKKSDKWGDSFCLQAMSPFCDSDLEASPDLHPDSDSDLEYDIDSDSYFNDICNSDQPKPTSDEDMGAYHLSEEEDMPADHHSEEDWGADHHSKRKGTHADHRSKEDRRANHLTKEDRRAIEIANNMPQLRELHLIRNRRLTNKGLNAILDKCLQLESLEIYCCFNVRIDGPLNAKLNRVKSEIPTITKVKCSPEIHTSKKLYMGRRPEIDTNILSEMGSGSDWRNWAQIPHSALSLIFQKLGAVNVQLSTKAVCHSWRQVALKGDLSLWRCIDMRSLPLDTSFRIHQENLTMSAVHSSTLVEELHLFSASDDLLINIAHRTTGLKCWTLMCCLDVSPKVLIDFLSRCPLLEELRLCICLFSHETFRDIGRMCSELKRLWVAAEPDSIESHDSEYEYRLSKKSDKWDGIYSLQDMSSFCDSDLEASPRLHPGTPKERAYLPITAPKSLWSAQSRHQRRHAIHGDCKQHATAARVVSH